MASNFDLLIFDMDGTLYDFVESNDHTILSSKFYKEVETNGTRFIAQRLSISLEEANVIRKRVFDLYNGDISIGLEKEYEISKREYFQNVWNIDARKYFNRNEKLINLISDISEKKVILTAAPIVWADNALKQLGIYDLFDGIWSGDDDIRKPNAEAYKQILDYFKIRPERTLVIDDEQRCLEQAKSLGIQTMLKGRPGTDNKAVDYIIREIYEITRYL
jgi:pyrimidine 5'-nucleotidase